MKLYIEQINDDGETIGVFEDCFCTCDDCVFFKRIHDDRLLRPYICMNPSGLVHPGPDGFCVYSVRKTKVKEEDHE